MLKEFVEHIQKTTQPLIQQVGSSTFVIKGIGGTEELHPAIYHPDTLPLHSLEALVKMVQTEALSVGEPLYITIPDHLTVRCFGQPQPDARYFRQVYYEARATDVPGWDNKVSLPFEEMQIALRTRFQETEDTPYVQKLLSDISTGAKVTYNDNGVATTVVTKKGIDLQSNQTIRPIVSLRPYRTFQEVEQPESVFLIRINDRGITFLEADGGMWKLKARETVKAYLEERLSEEVQNGCVIIAL